MSIDPEAMRPPAKFPLLCTINPANNANPPTVTRQSQNLRICPVLSFRASLRRRHLQPLRSRRTLSRTNPVGLSFAGKSFRPSFVEAPAREGICMLRLTKKADYGLMALKYLAEQSTPGAHAAVAQSAKDIAQAYHIPPPLLAKILQTLARAGLLVSHAGTNGGYALARPATKISAFEVIRAIDGPLFITSCITIHGSCDLAGHCTIKEPLRKVNDSIKDLLSNIHISDLIETAEATRGDEAIALGGRLVSILE